jgi:hypothetical protein
MLLKLLFGLFSTIYLAPSLRTSPISGRQRWNSRRLWLVSSTSLRICVGRSERPDRWSNDFLFLRQTVFLLNLNVNQNYSEFPLNGYHGMDIFVMLSLWAVSTVHCSPPCFIRSSKGLSVSPTSVLNSRVHAWFLCCNNVVLVWRAQIVKMLTTQFPPDSCYFL